MSSLLGRISTMYSEDRKYEFEELLELVSSANRFSVNFDTAWDWSDFPNKHRAEKVLRKYFTEREDFSVKLPPFEINSTRTDSPSKSKVIQISIDCWKSFALLSNTLRGRQLRQDILQCEAIVKRNSKHNIPKLSVHLEKAVQKNLTLQEILSRQWCDSLLKMKLATDLLKCSTVGDTRETYIEILASSCNQLLETFNSIEGLHLLSDLEQWRGSPHSQRSGVGNDSAVMERSGIAC